MTNYKTAIITGASRGLGEAIARSLAKDGWNLILTARSAAALEKVRIELSLQTSVIALPGSINDEAHLKEIARTAEQSGGIDLLINNAGALGTSPLPNLLSYSIKALKDVFTTNVFSQLGVIQAVQPYLKSSPMIINLTSDAAVEAYSGWGGYGASKAAFEQISAVLASENPDWKVFWVDPGDMRTQMHQDAFPGEDITDRPLPEVSVSGFLQLINGDFSSGRYQAQKLAKESFLPSA